MNKKLKNLIINIFIYLSEIKKRFFFYKKINKINIVSNNIIKNEIQSDLIENIGDFEITSSEKKIIDDNINNHSM